jgi:hypothetical protein
MSVTVARAADTAIGALGGCAPGGVGRAQPWRPQAQRPPQPHPPPAEPEPEVANTDSSRVTDALPHAGQAGSAAVRARSSSKRWPQSLHANS